MEQGGEVSVADLVFVVCVLVESSLEELPLWRACEIFRMGNVAEWCRGPQGEGYRTYEGFEYRSVGSLVFEKSLTNAWIE